MKSDLLRLGKQSFELKRIIESLQESYNQTEVIKISKILSNIFFRLLVSFKTFSKKFIPDLTLLN